MIESYKDLEVYKRSYNLALEIHQCTQTFPTYERHELGSQLRRAAVSIALNIAEGYGRKDSVKHFLRNAIGSCNETRVPIEMASDLGYIDEDKHVKLSQSYEILSKQMYRLKQAWTKK